MILNYCTGSVVPAGKDDASKKCTEGNAKTQTCIHFRQINDAAAAKKGAADKVSDRGARSANVKTAATLDQLANNPDVQKSPELSEAVAKFQAANAKAKAATDDTAAAEKALQATQAKDDPAIADAHVGGLDLMMPDGDVGKKYADYAAKPSAETKGALTAAFPAPLSKINGAADLLEASQKDVKQNVDPGIKNADAEVNEAIGLFKAGREKLEAFQAAQKAKNDASPGTAPRMSDKDVLVTTAGVQGSIDAAYGYETRVGKTAENYESQRYGAILPKLRAAGNAGDAVWQSLNNGANKATIEARWKKLAPAVSEAHALVHKPDNGGQDAGGKGSGTAQVPPENEDDDSGTK